MAKKPSTLPAIIDTDHEVVPFEQGMTLMPGQSTVVEVTLVDEEIVEGSGGFRMQDISGEVYGRYQHCTLDKTTGLWFADVDMAWSGPRPGAMPKPQQDTPELTRKAMAMWAASDVPAPDAYKSAIEAARASYVPPTPVAQPSTRTVVYGFLSKLFKPS